MHSDQMTDSFCSKDSMQVLCIHEASAEVITANLQAGAEVESAEREMKRAHAELAMLEDEATYLRARVG